MPAAAAFDALAEGWDAEHGPGSPPARVFADRTAYLRDVCRRDGISRVLELGCGTGRNLIALADILDHGTGVDAAPAMIRRARRNGSEARHLCFVTADAMRLSPVGGGPFEAVLFAGALEHMPPADAALAIAAALTVPGGRVIVIMPHPWRPRPRGAPPPQPIRLLSPRQLAAVAPHAGLRLTRLAGLGPALPWPCRAAPSWRPLTVSPPGSLRTACHPAYAAELTHTSA